MVKKSPKKMGKNTSSTSSEVGLSQSDLSLLELVNKKMDDLAKSMNIDRKVQKSEFELTEKMQDLASPAILTLATNLFQLMSWCADRENEREREKEKEREKEREKLTETEREKKIEPEKEKRGVGGGGGSGATLNGNGPVLPEVEVEAVNRSTAQSIRKLQQRMTFLEDELDETKQRNRKGGIVISSPTIQDPVTKEVKKESLFNFQGAEDELQKVIVLLNKRYNTNVEAKDVYAGHFLANGAYYIKFTNRNPNTSKWSAFIKQMRTGGPSGDKTMNLFASFDLTRQRLALVTTARKLKREGTISKFSTDENGAISVLFKEKWMKITRHRTKNGNFIATYSPAELTQLTN